MKSPGRTLICSDGGAGGASATAWKLDAGRTAAGGAGTGVCLPALAASSDLQVVRAGASNDGGGFRAGRSSKVSTTRSQVTTRAATRRPPTSSPAGVASAAQMSTLSPRRALRATISTVLSRRRSPTVTPSSRPVARAAPAWMSWARQRSARAARRSEPGSRRPTSRRVRVVSETITVGCITSRGRRYNEVMRVRCDGPACRLRAGDCGLGARDGEATGCLGRCDVPVAAEEAGRALTIVARWRLEPYQAPALPAQPGAPVILRDAGFRDQADFAAARRRGAYGALAKLEVAR